MSSAMKSTKTTKGLKRPTRTTKTWKTVQNKIRTKQQNMDS